MLMRLMELMRLSILVAFLGPRTVVDLPSALVNPINTTNRSNPLTRRFVAYAQVDPFLFLHLRVAG